FDFTAGFVSPEPLAGFGVYRMKDAGQIADVDDAVAHGGRRFADTFLRNFVLPAHLTPLQIARTEIPGAGANVDNAIDDSCGRLDRLSGIVGPEELQCFRDG